MKDILANLFGFIYSLSMGDYFFFIGTFLLIVLFIYIIYLIKCSDEETEAPNNSDDLFDLMAVTKQIETDYKPGKIELTHYEEEQENTAIISYEELVKNKDKLSIKYDDEFIFDTSELEVKKISLSDEAPVIPEAKLEVRLMPYDKEEAFLKALKELQNNLSR